MSLHGSVMLNGRTLGIYEIRRLSTEVHDFNDYAWWWVGVDRDERYEGTIKHEYSKGAAALVGAVLELVGELQNTS